MRIHKLEWKEQQFNFNQIRKIMEQASVISVPPSRDLVANALCARIEQLEAQAVRASADLYRNMGIGVYMWRTGKTIPTLGALLELCLRLDLSLSEIFAGNQRSTDNLIAAI